MSEATKQGVETEKLTTACGFTLQGNLPSFSRGAEHNVLDIFTVFCMRLCLIALLSVVTEMTYDMCVDIDEEPATLHITDTANTVGTTPTQLQCSFTEQQTITSRPLEDNCPFRPASR